MACDLIELAEVIENLRASTELHTAQEGGCTTRTHPWAACVTGYAALLRRSLKALSLTSSQANQLTTALCTWARHSAPAVAAECMRSLSILACQHLQDLEGASKSSLLVLLRAAIPQTPSLDPLKASHEPLSALETVLATHASSLPQEWLAECYAAQLASIHRTVDSHCVLVTDPWHCSFYTSQLRILTHCLAAPGTVIAPGASALVDALSRFWSLSSPLTPDPSSGGGGRHYVPPHRCSRGTPTATSGSDSSGSSRSNSTPPVATVRLAALSALAAALCNDAPALHPVWNRLLPASPTDRATTTLVYVLLHDPHPPCRAAAATAIHLMTSHRKVRPFMAIAKAPPRMAASAGHAFTPLSASLAAMLSSLHCDLSSALRTEMDAEARLAMLRAAASLASSTPYPRMPAGQLDDLFSAVCSLWRPSWAGPDVLGGQVCLQNLCMSDECCLRRLCLDCRLAMLRAATSLVSSTRFPLHAGRAA